METDTLIYNFKEIVGKNGDVNIVLLKQPGVIEWLIEEKQFVAFLDSIYPELLLLSEQKTTKGKNLPKSKIREEYKKKRRRMGAKYVVKKTSRFIETWSMDDKIRRT